MRLLFSFVALLVTSWGLLAQDDPIGFKKRTGSAPFAKLTYSELKRGELSLMPCFQALAKLNDELLEIKPDFARGQKFVDDASNALLKIPTGAKGSIQFVLHDGMSTIFSKHDQQFKRVKAAARKTDRPESTLDVEKRQTLSIRADLVWLSDAFADNDGYKISRVKK